MIALALVVGWSTGAHAQSRRGASSDAPLLARLFRIDPPIRAPELDEPVYLLPLLFVDAQEAPGLPGRPEFIPQTSSLVVHLPVGAATEAELRRARRRYRVGRWYRVRVRTIFEGTLPATVELSPRGGRAVCTTPEDHVGRFAPSDIGDSTVRRVELALDGGPTGEIALAFESLCGASGNCTYYVYEMRAGCAEYIGSTEGEPAPADRSRAGRRDLLSVEHLGPGRWVERRYRFDGRRYRAAGSRRCAEAPGSEPSCSGW